MSLDHAAMLRYQKLKAQIAALSDGVDGPMTTEELRDLLGAIIHGHSRKDSTDWDLNLAMIGVEKHVAYRIEAFLAGQAQEQTSPSKGDQVT
ncbi:hypothetical protein OG369_42540 [Streptomyces sp. NBC_01221]|uniref:hypothetical protein n=1 Tax=Streptomyces sp. NBC_01221 TaxID=2903782 RepID=UPI0022501B13|nr:hypothetical protein [Streptomyces sp. NBC_01221]MCX4792457.1 hypothetical protein [Streptomyces sp. NBC_01221]